MFTTKLCGNLQPVVFCPSHMNLHKINFKNVINSRFVMITQFMPFLFTLADEGFNFNWKRYSV